MALTFVPKNSNAKTAVFLEANFKNEFYTILPPWRRLFRVTSFYRPFNVFDQTHSKETAQRKKKASDL